MTAHHPSNAIFVSWTRENGRTRDLADALGMTAHYVYRPSRLGLLGRYVKQLCETRRLIRRARPSAVVLMLPPAPALLALIATLPQDAYFMVDLHTGFFEDPKWKWARRVSLAYVKRAGGVAIVTNEHLALVCERSRVESLVLHDVIHARAPRTSKGHLLCPLSYANDEPVDELLEAARLRPEHTWVFTGRAPDTVRAKAPDNVSFTGFVNDEVYSELLASAGAVVALTNRPYTMQRAGYEAFSSCVPQVTSDFPELRSFYEDSAEYTAPLPPRIAEAVDRVCESRERYIERIQLLRESRMSEQQKTLEHIRQRISEAGAQPGFRVAGKSQ